MTEMHIPSTVLVSNDSLVVDHVISCFLSDEAVNVVSNAPDYEALSIEFPDLMILDFSDWELGFDILDLVISDHWLHHQSIITICSSYEVGRRIEGHKAVNLIAAISKYEIVSELPKLLNVIRQNHRILFQRALGTDFLLGIFGYFTIRNDMIEVECMVNMVCSYLYNSNRVDWAGKNRLQTALTELLVNAIEHGNCSIGFDRKREWLSENNMIDELIQERLDIAETSEKKITFEYEISPKKSIFTITDEGNGFDWQNYLDSHEDADFTASNGRGIIMAMASVDELVYNEKGNSVQAIINHKELSSNEYPAVLSHLEVEELEPEEVIIREGERSDSLFFIVKGKFNVSVDGKRVSEVTPDDIFMGEMSFLLNGRRSATVTAATDAKLIRITRKEFVKIMKEHPHYGFFLARLLAQRLDKLNHSDTGLS